VGSRGEQGLEDEGSRGREMGHSGSKGDKRLEERRVEGPWWLHGVEPGQRGLEAFEKSTW
jgi:hypothetical protein